jgi:hypothetical protein
MDNNHQSPGGPGDWCIESGQQAIAIREGKLFELTRFRQMSGRPQGVSQGLQVPPQPGKTLAEGS